MPVVTVGAAVSVTVVGVRAVISYVDVTAPFASRNSIQEPMTESGTAAESVTVAPLTAMTVPVPRSASVLVFVVLSVRPRLSRISSSKVLSCVALTWRR